MQEISAEGRLTAFIAKYSPEIESQAHVALEKMRARLPGAIQLVWDNYNALAIGFGPTERQSDLIFSITLYPRWISLFFVHGVDLPDPHKLLRGSGKSIRHVVLKGPESLDTPAVQTLIAKALSRAPKPLDPTQPDRVVIKSIAAKQRRRRP